jgi:uncharacterized protein (DUF2225 family)
MKQTAVEWQFNELQKAEKDWKNDAIDGMEYTERKYVILKQAKEMEKGQSNAKIQKAIEKFEELQSKASSLKDVIYLGGVLSALEVIKNETFKQEEQ